MIYRGGYIKQLAGFKDKNVIKVITGIRRCGKSTLMAQYAEELLKTGVSQEQIISVNFEDYANLHLCEPEALHKYILENSGAKHKTYVFLDEIQNVREFQRVVDSLYLRKNLDIYLTGSNAWLLSGELATLLSGRYVKIEILPLSLSEFMQSCGGTPDYSRVYRIYTEQSSFPGALEYAGNIDLIRKYLRGIYDSVVLKDVITRYRIADPMMLESVLCFAFDNTGSLISTKRISDYMNAGNRKIDVKTVERYLTALTDSYILYRAKRYNIKGKEHLKTLEKYYAADVGLMSVMTGANRRGLNVGHILENIIYLELRRRGYDVYVGKLDEYEIDYVAVCNTETLYVQVSASVRDTAVLNREIKPLQKIRDSYPKLLLTLDDDPIADYDGIKRMNAVDWLLGSSGFAGLLPPLKKTAL